MEAKQEETGGVTVTRANFSLDGLTKSEFSISAERMAEINQKIAVRTKENERILNRSLAAAEHIWTGC